MAGSLRSPQIFFRCAPENFAMRQPVACGISGFGVGITKPFTVKEISKLLKNLIENRTGKQ